MHLLLEAALIGLLLEITCGLAMYLLGRKTMEFFMMPDDKSNLLAEIPESFKHGPLWGIFYLLDVLITFLPYDMIGGMAYEVISEPLALSEKVLWLLGCLLLMTFMTLEYRQGRQQRQQGHIVPGRDYGYRTGCALRQ